LPIADWRLKSTGSRLQRDPTIFNRQLAIGNWRSAIGN